MKQIKFCEEEMSDEDSAFTEDELKRIKESLKRNHKLMKMLAKV